MSIRTNRSIIWIGAVASVVCLGLGIFVLVDDGDEGRQIEPSRGSTDSKSTEEIVADIRANDPVSDPIPRLSVKQRASARTIANRFWLVNKIADPSAREIDNVAVWYSSDRELIGASVYVRFPGMVDTEMMEWPSLETSDDQALNPDDLPPTTSERFSIENLEEVLLLIDVKTGRVRSAIPRGPRAYIRYAGDGPVQGEGTGL